MTYSAGLYLLKSPSELNATMRTGCPLGSWECVAFTKKARTASRCWSAARTSASFSSAYMSKCAEVACTHLSAAKMRAEGSESDRTASTQRGVKRIIGVNLQQPFYMEIGGYERLLIFRQPALRSCHRQGTSRPRPGERRGESFRGSV